MSFCSLEEKSIKFERIANNFISSIFKSVIVKYNKEKEIKSRNISNKKCYNYKKNILELVVRKVNIIHQIKIKEFLKLIVIFLVKLM